EARRVVGVAADLAPTRDEFALSVAALRRLGGAVENTNPLGELRLPVEFRPLLNGSPLSGPFLEYLRQRDFRDAQIQWLAENYDLRYATQGRFAYRIVLPVRDRYGSLLTWTGRAVSPGAEPRYLTLTVDAKGDLPVARKPINDTIL